MTALIANLDASFKASLARQVVTDAALPSSCCLDSHRLMQLALQLVGLAIALHRQRDSGLRGGPLEVVGRGSAAILPQPLLLVGQVVLKLDGDVGAGAGAGQAPPLAHLGRDPTLSIRGLQWPVAIQHTHVLLMQLIGRFKQIHVRDA